MQDYLFLKRMAGMSLINELCKYGDIKSYVVFDLHAGYEINERVKVNLTLNNMFDHRHVEIIGGPALGRIALLRLTTTL